MVYIICTICSTYVINYFFLGLAEGEKTALKSKELKKMIVGGAGGKEWGRTHIMRAWVGVERKCRRGGSIRLRGWQFMVIQPCPDLSLFFLF